MILETAQETKMRIMQKPRIDHKNLALDTKLPGEYRSAFYLKNTLYPK